MKHENLFKIHIPEPCHEDWTKMTPNEQGAFCKVCCKTVVDFSVKTDEEVNQFLEENAGQKICGRFKATQLEETPKLKNEIPKYKINFPGYLFPTSYALALFVVASMALVGCSNSDGGSSGDDDKVKIEHVAGGFEIKPDSLKNRRIDKDTVYKNLDQKKKEDDAVNINKPDIRLLGTPVMRRDTAKTTGDTVKVNYNNHVKMGLIKKIEPKDK